MNMKVSKEVAKKYGLDTVPNWKQEAAKTGKERPKDGKTGQDKPAQKAFLALCKAHGIPVPDCEYRFAESIGRKWRFDYLFDGWLAVEQEGGIWTGGRHNRAVGFIADAEKYNHAVLLGYSVIRFTPQQMTSGEACAFIKRVLNGEGEQS